MNIFEQLTEDVAYCTQALGCTIEQTDEIIQAAGTLGINAQYFCEEFIVAPEDQNCMKYQREDFMDLDVFNHTHGIYFEEVEE